jgi:hypothetical protein
LIRIHVCWYVHPDRERDGWPAHLREARCEDCERAIEMERVHETTGTALERAAGPIAHLCIPCAVQRMRLSGRREGRGHHVAFVGVGRAIKKLFQELGIIPEGGA